MRLRRGKSVRLRRGNQLMQQRNKGFALLIVLWSLVLIGLLTTQIIASGRTAMLLAGNLREAAQARAAADGAINEAIYHLIVSGADNWQADGTVHVLQDGGIPIAVRVDSLAGEINPNLASTGLLAGLFQAVGASPGQAREIAGAIIQWRTPPLNKQDAKARIAEYRQMGLPYAPPGHDLSDLSELADIAYMPPALLASAMPYLNLYQSGDPDPAKAAPKVRQALALSGQTGTNANVYTGTSPVVSIQAVAGIKGRFAVRRNAIVSVIGQNGSSPFKILSLADGK